MGGRGLGRHAGKAVFVPLTAPGDQVRCRVVRSRSHYDEAEIDALLVPAPERREPPCPVFGLCGGCQWQHLPYALQATWKERLFREALVRAGVAGEEAVQPLVPAPAEWGYRNRAQFKCFLTAAGLVSGFYRHGSHHVVDTPRCLLVNEPLRDVYARLRPELAGGPRPAAIPQFDLAADDDNRVALLLHALPAAVPALRPWLKALAGRLGLAAGLQAGRKETIEVVAGDPGCTLSVDDPPMTLRVSPGGFAQVNPAQNRALVAAVIEAARLTGNERLLDLFCGAGNFSLPLARRAAEVVGVESYPPAIADARRNAARNGIANAHFLCEGAESALSRLAAARPFDVVLLDPPRAGAYPVMRALLAAGPQRILYVSCEPTTLVRDLKPLIHGGYAVVFSQAFDLFPQTWHVESLTVLERCT